MCTTIFYDLTKKCNCSQHNNGNAQRLQKNIVLIFFCIFGCCRTSSFCKLCAITNSKWSVSLLACWLEFFLAPHHIICRSLWTCFLYSNKENTSAQEAECVHITYSVFRIPFTSYYLCLYYILILYSNLARLWHGFYDNQFLLDNFHNFISY